MVFFELGFGNVIKCRKLVLICIDRVKEKYKETIHLYRCLSSRTLKQNYFNWVIEINKKCFVSYSIF